MNKNHIRLTLDQSVARITLDRVDRRNALTRAMIGDLTTAVNEVSANEDVRVLLLAANGTVFCAGMDLSEMQQRAAEKNAKQEWRVDSQVYCDLLLALLDAPFPTIAVVQGPVLAGGVGLVLACDLVLAAEEAFFALPEPQRGITAAMVTPLLTFRVGAAHASHLLLTTQRVAAADTVAWGLCHEVVRRDDLDAAECELVGSVLASSPAALAATKQNIRQFAAADLARQLKSAATLSAASRETDDAREGLRAFLEKRKPNWQAEDESKTKSPP